MRVVVAKGQEGEISALKLIKRRVEFGRKVCEFRSLITRK